MKDEETWETREKRKRKGGVVGAGGSSKRTDPCGPIQSAPVPNVTRQDSWNGPGGLPPFPLKVVFDLPALAALCMLLCTTAHQEPGKNHLLCLRYLRVSVERTGQQGLMGTGSRPTHNGGVLFVTSSDRGCNEHP